MIRNEVIRNNLGVKESKDKSGESLKVVVSPIQKMKELSIMKNDSIQIAVKEEKKKTIKFGYKR